MQNILQIKNLKVLVEDSSYHPAPSSVKHHSSGSLPSGEAGSRMILNGVDLEIKPGEVQAILGPNGCGKSSLAQTIAGNPCYEIIDGKVIYDGETINNLPMEERVLQGIALAMQSPPAIKGVKLDALLDLISPFGRQVLNEKTEVPLGRNLLKRDVNLGFSGGEKKISELLQVLALDPRLLILDEIDAGLDVKNLEKITEIIREKFIAVGVSILVITHSGKILESLKPDVTNVMLEGKIICQSQDFKKLLNTIQKYGYKKCEHCPFQTD